MGKVKRAINRGNDTSDLTIIVKANDNDEMKILKKEIQKMIRNSNHLLKKKMNYEMITIQHSRGSHQGVKQSQSYRSH